MTRKEKRKKRKENNKKKRKENNITTRKEKIKEYLLNLSVKAVCAQALQPLLVLPHCFSNP